MLPKAPYAPFPYSAIIDRPPLRWPNGARIAFWVGPNIEFFPLDGKLAGMSAPNVPGWAERDYGNRVGIWRMMDLLDRYKIRATVCLNSDICIQHPRIIEEGEKRGWEWMGHSTTNAIHFTDLTEEAQKEAIERSMEIITRSTGRKPRGWLSPALKETWSTLGYLADAGIDYICDWCNDDQPLTMTLEDGREMTVVQYAHELNDLPVFSRQMKSPEQFRDMIVRTFDVLYREAERDDTGKVMAIALHPYLTGLPHRIDMLEEAIAHICGHDKVWLATGSEIVDAYRSQRPSFP